MRADSVTRSGRWSVIRAGWLGALLGLLLASWGEAAAQEVPAAARREFKRIESTLADAERFLQASRFDRAGGKLTEAVNALQPVAAAPSPELIEAAKPLFDRVKGIHGQLSLEGVEVPNLAALEIAFGGDAGEPIMGGVSFDKEIAPLLVGKCGRCHVSEARGDFQMADYNQLMTGTAGGRVVLAGNGEGSRLVQVIEEGDMPRGGGRVTPEELTLLKKWIDEGARASAAVRASNLAVLAQAAGGTTERPKAPELQWATGDETISFASDVAPIMIEHCSGCHLETQNVSGQLNLQTFAGWLRGGASGPMITVGQPEESLLIQKLRGTAGGDRMPRGRDPLAEEEIETISKWIQEGAKFDGMAGDQSIIVVYGQAKAIKASHEELRAERMSLAESNWKLGLPSVTAERIESDNFLVLGNADRTVLETVSKRSEALAPAVVRWFRGNSREPFVKGRLTLYVFRGRYDYAEFGTMVEKRQVPAEWTQHRRYDVIDSYAALLPPREIEEETLDGLLVQQLAAAYAAQLGKNVPAWFANGCGYLAVTKLAREDTRIKQWETLVPTLISRMEKPDDFLAGRMPEDHAGLVAMTFVDRMSQDTRRWNAFLSALRKGEDFATAFQATYGGTPADWVGAPAAGNPSNSRRQR